MTRTTRTLVATVAATATLGLAAGLTTAPVQAASGHQAAARAATTHASRFALRGWAYGSAVTAGPVGSGATGFESIGCTTRTGLVRTNHQASATVPSLGNVSNLSSRVWTTRSGSTVSSWARNTLGQVTLSDSPLGSVILDAVSSTSRAYHSRSGFHASTEVELAKLVFKPAIGPAQTFKLPKPGRPVTIPGVAKVEIAATSERTTAHSGQAVANGLRVTLQRTQSVVKIARSVAQISDGIVTGVFGGNSYGIGGKAAGDLVNVGRNPLLRMPCSGTAGETQTRKLAGVDLGAASVGTAISQQHTTQTRTRATGWERSQVASVKLGDNVEINGIIAKATVTRAGRKLTTLRRSAAGTSVGTLTVNGQTRDIPLTQTLTIPGVAELRPRIVTKIPNGLVVTALRVTLLDGSGAVLDLGNARMLIRRSGS